MSAFEKSNLILADYRQCFNAAAADLKTGTDLRLLDTRDLGILLCSRRQSMGIPPRSDAQNESCLVLLKRLTAAAKEQTHSLQPSLEYASLTRLMLGLDPFRAYRHFCLDESTKRGTWVLPGFDRPPDSRNNATEVELAASTDISLTDMRDAEKHPPLIDRQSASIRSRSRQVKPKQPIAAAAEDCSLRQAPRCLLRIAGLRRSIVWIGILS